MTISEGIKQFKGCPAEIPDTSRNDLGEFFKEMGFTVGAEIGVYKGDFTTTFLDAGLTVYAVDPWMPYKDFDIESENRKDRQDFLFRHTQKKLAKYGDKVKFIRKTSMDALDDIPDGSLDFVYIDGNHKFKYVAEDLVEWSKKVKKGGVICGHDYCHPSRLKKDRWDDYQVIFVIDAFVKAYRIEDFWVLGGKRELPGEKRDRFRSWMWFNK